MLPHIAFFITSFFFHFLRFHWSFFWLDDFTASGSWHWAQSEQICSYFCSYLNFILSYWDSEHFSILLFRLFFSSYENKILWLKPFKSIFSNCALWYFNSSYLTNRLASLSLQKWKLLSWWHWILEGKVSCTSALLN